MAGPLDVFRIPAEGGVRWIGTVETLEAAKALIKATSEKQPGGDFLVVNLDTGDKLKIKAEPAA